MKRLIVLRHGTAEQPKFGHSDFDRELTKRGEDDSLRVGEVLLERDLKPDVIVSSAAKRAFTTAKRVADGCGFERAVIEHSELYSASLSIILNVIRTSISDTASTALIVGHNPGFHYTIEHFGGSDISLPPTAWASIELQVESWTDVDREIESDVTNFWTPNSDSS
jgi:phosphohistidine phosphatase